MEEENGNLNIQPWEWLKHFTSHLLSSVELNIFKECLDADGI